MALTFRFAQETDTLLILQFIRELADYEHLPPRRRGGGR